MAPTLTLRDYSPDISAWAAAANQTNQKQSGNSTVDTSSPVGFVVPLVVTIGILAIVMAAFAYQMLVLYRRPFRESPAAARISRAAVRAERKREIGRKVVSEPFFTWRDKQLAKMKSRYALPTQAICMVCLSEFTDDDLVRDLNCSHVFHVNCLDEWYSRGHNQCPLCKSELCHLKAANSNSELHAGPSW